MCICWLVGWFVCSQGEEISMKLVWRIALGREKTPLAFGADPGNGDGFRFFFCHLDVNERSQVYSSGYE